MIQNIENHWVDHMNMSMKSILIRIIMDLIILKILKQHLLVQQKKKTTIRPKLHPTTEIESTSGENTKNSHATEMSTAESSKHYLR